MNESFTTSLVAENVCQCALILLELYRKAIVYPVSTPPLMPGCGPRRLPKLAASVPGALPAASVRARRADIAQVPRLYFLPSDVPTAFATGVSDQSVIVVSSGLLRLLMTGELTGVLAHEITHIAKHDAELMQLAGIVGQMTRLIAQVAIIIAMATSLLDIFGSGEGVDWLSLGVLVAAPIVANLILGAGFDTLSCFTCQSL